MAGWNAVKWIGAAGIAVLGSASAAQAAEFEWTLSAFSVVGNPINTLSRELPDRILKATDGRLQITSNYSLVNPGRQLEAIRDGVVEMAAVINGAYTATYPLVGVPFLPGLTTDPDKLHALWESELGDAVKETFRDEFNAEVVMEGVFCPNILVSTQEVATREDFRGLQMRTNAQPAALWMAELGANIVALSHAELGPALQRRMIQATITDGCWAYETGFFDGLVTHASDWGFYESGFPLVVNIDAWNSLPDDLREAVQAELRQIEAEYRAARPEIEARMWEGIASKGTVTEIAPEEIAAIHDQAITDNVFAEWSRGAVDAGLDAEKWLGVAREVTAE